MQNVWFAAASWMGVAFVASVVSIRLGISVALIKIGVNQIRGLLAEYGLVVAQGIRR